MAAGVCTQGEMLVFEDEMLTIDDVAAYLKLKPQTIYKWAQTGKIPGAKFGKEWRFRRSAIEQWIDRQISSQTRAPPPADLTGAGEGGDGGDMAADGSGRVKRTPRGSEKVESSSASKPKTSRVPKDDRGPAKN